jgi:hypothetical protein
MVRRLSTPQTARSAPHMAGNARGQFGVAGNARERVGMAETALQQPRVGPSGTDLSGA